MKKEIVYLNTIWMIMFVLTIAMIMFLSTNFETNITGNVILNLNQNNITIIFNNYDMILAGNFAYQLNTSSAIADNQIELSPLINQNDLISIGNPCDNTFSKKIMNFSNLPSDKTQCYDYINNNLSMNLGDYILKGVISPYNSSKIIVIFFAYNSETWNYAKRNFTNYEISSTTNIKGYVNLTQLNNLNCTSNWNEIKTPCNINDSLIIWYNDTNRCNSLAGIPTNKTINCDYDNNGIIGNISTITNENLVIQVYIDSNPMDISKIFNITKIITFNDENITRINFSYNFSKPLDLKNIFIKKQPSNGNRGYLIINGINESKTVTIDKLNSTSNSVCIKNSIITLISSILDNCDAIDETLLSCPGDEEEYICEIKNNKFVISGVEHSAIEEFFIENSSICNPSWNCSLWLNCTNNQQTRLCADFNHCNTLIGKPIEIQSCGPSCTSQWNCTSWTPEKCPKNQTQTRQCRDINNCAASTNKLPENQTCEYKSNSSVLIILIIILALIALIGAIYLLYSKRPTGGNVIIQKPQMPPSQPPQNYYLPNQQINPTQYLPIPEQKNSQSMD